MNEWEQWSDQLLNMFIFGSMNDSPAADDDIVKSPQWDIFCMLGDHIALKTIQDMQIVQ